MTTIRYSVNYEELINELNEELQDGTLNLDSLIQILRMNEDSWKSKYKNIHIPFFKKMGIKNITTDSYRPIVDWFYSNEDMNEVLKIECCCSKEEAKDIEEDRELYYKDKPYLEVMTVEEVLKEMIGRNEIFI